MKTTKTNKTMRNFAKLMVFLSVGCAHIASPLKGDFVSPSGMNNSEEQYIILTNVDQSDPYYLTVRALQNYRNATVLSFDPTDVWAIKDSLKQHNARYVAVVLKPIDIDLNLAREFLMMSTELDDDPFSDFSYGFITGATSQDALNFVNRIIKAESESIQNKPLKISGYAASNINQVYTYDDSYVVNYLNISDYSLIYLKEGDPQAMDFFFDEVHHMNNAKILDIGNNGDPHMLWLFEGGNSVPDIWEYDPILVENPPVQRLGLTSKHIQELNLYPAVALNGACHSGVLKRACVEEDIAATFGYTGGKIRFYEMSDEFSFALSILKTGITGYFAPIGSNNSNDKSEEVYNIFLYNEPLGDIHKRTVDGVVMGFIGNRPNLKIFVEGASTEGYETLASGTYNPVDFSLGQSMMLSGKANRIYYGDPLFNPFANDCASELNLVTTSLTTIGTSALQLDLSFDKPEIYFPVWDKFHEGRTRVYMPVEIPDKFYGANIQIMNTSGTYDRFIYAFERFDGKTILHVEIDIPDEFIGNAVRFNMSLRIDVVSKSWHYDLQSPSYGGGAVGDIDNDNRLEVVFGTYFNDEHLYALNGEDGSLLWKFQSLGGPIDTSVTIADINKDDNLEVLFADSAYGVVFCLDGRNGIEIWRYCLNDSTDSPPSVGELNNNDDGMPEVVVGDFSGNVYVINGQDGTLVWKNDKDITGRVNSGPTLLDVNGDGNLDVVVTTWNGDNKVHALRGSDGTELWSFQTGGSMYHGPSFADIDENDGGMPELVFTSKDGYLYVLNCENGSEVWKRYIGIWPDEDLFAPTSIADTNNDGHLEIVVSGYNLYAYSYEGIRLWKYEHQAISIARGVAIADIDGDRVLDLAFGDSYGIFSIVKGSDGSLSWSFDARSDYGDDEFKIDHSPIIADFDCDGYLDVFFVGGRGYSYPEPENNYGRAYMIRKTGGTGEGWHMFKHDLVRSGCYSPAWECK